MTPVTQAVTQAVIAVVIYWVVTAAATGAVTGNATLLAIPFPAEPGHGCTKVAALNALPTPTRFLVALPRPAALAIRYKMRVFCSISVCFHSGLIYLADVAIACKHTRPHSPDVERMCVCI